MLHVKDQVSPTYTEVDLRLCFHWGVNRAQYVDTLLLFTIAFANRDHGSGPSFVTLSLFQISVKCKWVPTCRWLQCTVEGHLELAKWEVMWW